MKILQIILLVILVALSLAAGTAKVMQMDQEIEFFRQAGLDAAAVLPFGAFQLAGALLAIVPKTKTIGIAIMGLAFLLSAILIFMAGNIAFGIISLLPAAVAAMLTRRYSNQANIVQS